MSAITFDKRGSHEGFLRGEVFFFDGSQLHLREFIDTETVVTRLLYAYHYVDANSSLIFRYDNTSHHKKLKLDSFSHHKHDGSESKVISSIGPTLAEVIQEIAAQTQLPEE